jgi:hypothetical protein
VNYEALISDDSGILIPCIMPPSLGGFKGEEVEFVDILREFKLARIIGVFNYHFYFSLE